MRLRVIGPGRAGSSLARALAAAGWDVAAPVRHGDDVADAAAGVDLLVIATPDAAVAGVAAAITPVDATVVAHLAGSMGLEALAPHPRRAAVHPLRSIPLPDTDLTGAWFAVGGDPLAGRVVDDLGGRRVSVADEDRAAYHAAACIASNHLVALLGQVERVAATAGVALEAYADLVRQTVDNVAALGPAAALTGPVRRGDEVTVARHVAAIDPSERPAYEALADAARRLASGAGGPRGGQSRAQPAWPKAGARPSGCSRVNVIETVGAFSAALDVERRAGRTVGLVPTMGALHDGHASLVERAAAECDVVAVTVFVNPLQFGAGEDLDAYPRTLDADVKRAEQAGASIVFAPTVAEMYGDGTATTVSLAGGMTRVLEGASRPGHFDGVSTVVAKLFAMAGVCRAYFGEKDFQQLAVVRRMARDLSFPVTVVGCPTIRAEDGLALSSRNVYLGEDERVAAPVLLRALQAGAAAIGAGERDPAGVRAAMDAVLATEPLVSPDYAVVVDAATLETPGSLIGDLRLLVAARLPSARLIDNLGVTVSGTHRKDAGCAAE